MARNTDEFQFDALSYEGVVSLLNVVQTNTLRETSPGGVRRKGERKEAPEIRPGKFIGWICERRRCACGLLLGEGGSCIFS